MDKFVQIDIPNNFNTILPELKTKSLKWETFCYSGTQLNQSAKIAFYSALDDKPYGNIVLTPGLAANTEMDPLMKVLIFWSLTHKYNVFTFDTFLGDFCKEPSVEQAKRNTFPEFVSLLESSIKFIEPYSINNTNILIGHSAGATGLINALNNMVKQNHKIHIHSVLLFAPCINNISDELFKTVISKYNKLKTFDDCEGILPMTNVFDIQHSKTIRYISITQKFLIDLQKAPFRPDLMNKWGAYVTVVAGGKDRKISCQELKKNFQELQKQPNSNLFDFIILPNAKHSFSNTRTDIPVIIDLIKSQRTRTK